ncbi:hypothetical protein FQA39_LY00262 [Lamprigera yunnana]|nr:hypothetical protein FQA39_LY00262 [Lamprigera yunnana]
MNKEIVKNDEDNNKRRNTVERMLVLEKLDNEITTFRENLKKDNIQRREDRDIVKRKLNELNKYKEHFNNIKAEVANKIQNKEIKSDQSALINNLLKYVVLKLNEIDTIIQKRLENLDAPVTLLNLESSSAQNSENIFDYNTETKISENFDFKTTASLLPKVGNDLNTIYQLIEGIELYEPSLSAAGKPLLINYVRFE